MGQLLGPQFPDRIGLAVSGGGDSMAMLHLCAGWARVYGVSLAVVTVDHGLRDASVTEAAMVADDCAVLGLPHTILRWTWDGTGNLQDAARDARLSLIGAWADGRSVLFGHTRDDQAETLLMRLARGSGVDGLAAMAGGRDAGGWRIVRPLLAMSRSDLRHYVHVLKIPFVDDPSNDDPRFARVRMRRLIGQEGLDTERLAQTAQAMARAQTALMARAYDVACNLQRPTTPGCIALDRNALAQVEEETQLRLLAGAVGFVTAARYRPRLATLTRTLETVLAGGTATLQGAILAPQGANLVIAREAKAVAELVVPVGPDALWDGRWSAVGDAADGLTIRALGEAGLGQIRVRPEDAAPRLCLTGLPSIWKVDTLIACQALGYGDGPHLTDRSSGSFPQVLLAH